MTKQTMDTQTILDALEDPTILERAVSRRDAVRRSGLLGAGLAVATLPAMMTALAGRAFAQGAPLPNQIVNALNVAFILENLEADFYRLGLEADGLIPSADRAIFEQISKHETAHVAFLAGVLGDRKARLPRFDFTAGGAFDAFGDYATFQLLAQGFEDFGVRAYKGQAPNLMASDAVLTAALRIHSVEARHASQIRRLRGQKGWIPGNDPAATAALALVYAGEDNVTHLGVNVGNYEGAGDTAEERMTAATEAFDEPVTDLRQVLTVVGTFTVK